MDDKKLAALFPGIGYHCDKPLLYYSAKLALAETMKRIDSFIREGSASERGDGI